MTTKSYTIRTPKNVWTFDVSLPKGGTPKVLRTYGDVTNREALDEALVQLKQHVDKDVAGVGSGRRGREALYPEYIRGVQKPRGLGYYVVIDRDPEGRYQHMDHARFKTKTQAAAFITVNKARGVTFKVQP